MSIAGPLKNALKYFGIIMVFVYLGIGTWVLFSKSFIFMPDNIRFGFALFAISYGLFRLAKIIINRKSNKEDETD